MTQICSLVTEMAVLRFSSLVTVLIFVTFIVNCVNSEERITDGIVAKPGQFPYTVSLRNLNKIHFCGGALINNYWTITAARCTRAQNSQPSGVLITVAAHRSSNDGIMYRTQVIVNHPNFNLQNRENDISMIRSADFVDYRSNVRPIALPTTDITEIHVGNFRAIVIGWGAPHAPIAEQPFYLSEVLRYQKKTVLARQSCRRHLGHVDGRFVHEATTICTQNYHTKGVCPGDEGSPLVSAGGKLTGIVTWGKGCGRNFPDVYTRIFPFLKWIRSNALQ